MFEFVIQGGRIIDVKRGKIYEGDIGVSDGKIKAISQFPLKGFQILNAEGMIISPGFIDIHMHEDTMSYESESVVIVDDIFKCMSLMGVTTCIGGNCGINMSTDVKKYFSTVDEKGLSVNYGSYLGYSTLREKIGINDRYKPCNEQEIRKISSLIAEGLEYGALGVSFGIEYTPGSTTNEIIEASKTVSRYSGKLLAAHFRVDADRGAESVKEMIYISWVTGVPMQISHIGSCAAYGYMEDSLKLIETARKSGIDVMADCYPYNAFSTFVGSAVFDEGCFERWNADYDVLIVTEGKYKGQKCTKEIFDYLREKEPNTYVVVRVMNQNDVDMAVLHPHVMVASDGGIHDGQGHPRAAGTFPRVLKQYVRDKKKLTLIEAIRKMTVMPAERLGLKNKGVIDIGADADFTIFAPDEVEDMSSFENPVAPPRGIKHVIVNGSLVVCDGIRTGAKPGRMIRF